MSVFFSWLGSSLQQWWQFLSSTLVPGFQFSFAALLMAVFFFNLAIIVLQFVIRKDAGGREYSPDRHQKKGGKGS